MYQIRISIKQINKYGYESYNKEYNVPIDLTEEEIPRFKNNINTLFPIDAVIKSIDEIYDKMFKDKIIISAKLIQEL